MSAMSLRTEFNVCSSLEIIANIQGKVFFVLSLNEWKNKKRPSTMQSHGVGNYLLARKGRRRGNRKRSDGEMDENLKADLGSFCVKILSFSCAG